jgi:hypothetical protein
MYQVLVLNNPQCGGKNYVSLFFVFLHSFRRLSNSFTRGFRASHDDVPSSPLPGSYTNPNSYLQLRHHQQQLHSEEAAASFSPSPQQDGDSYLMTRIQTEVTQDHGIITEATTEETEKQEREDAGKDDTVLVTPSSSAPPSSSLTALMAKSPPLSSGKNRSAAAAPLSPVKDTTRSVGLIAILFTRLKDISIEDHSSSTVTSPTISPLPSTALSFASPAFRTTGANSKGSLSSPVASKFRNNDPSTLPV